MICCVTGHSPKSFPFDIQSGMSVGYILYMDALYTTVEKLICEGYSHFITGMADGADINFGDCVSYYKCSCNPEWNYLGRYLGYD